MNSKSFILRNLNPWRAGGRMEATGWKRDASNEALQIVPGVRVCLLGGCYIVEDLCGGVTPLALYWTQ